MFNSQIIEKIITYTNKKLKKEVPISELEFKAFIGLTLLFSITKKNDVEVDEMWNFESVHHMDYATACMSRNRFKLIMRSLAFDDIDSRQIRLINSNNNKFIKISEIFEMFSLSIKVILVSTLHHRENDDTITKKPEIISHYNKTKGTVDCLDKMVEKFTCRRRTQKWTINIFFYMLDIAARNAYALYNIKNPS
jgi:hypothetical protein